MHHLTCRAKFRHSVVSLGNDDTKGQVADYLIFNGASRFWNIDEETFGEGGRHHPFLDIGEKYHAWVMLQVSSQLRIDYI